MVITHTIKIRSSDKKWANGTTMAAQNVKYEACIVATATQKTVDLVNQELAAGEAKTAELKRELEGIFQTLGVTSEEGFNAKYKGGDSRMGLVVNARDLLTRIHSLTLETARVRKVSPGLGGQAVVAWKRTVEVAERDLKSLQCTQFLRKGYDLKVRTDIKTVSKPERSKAA